MAELVRRNGVVSRTWEIRAHLEIVDGDRLRKVVITLPALPLLKDPSAIKDVTVFHCQCDRLWVELGKACPARCGTCKRTNHVSGRHTKALMSRLEQQTVFLSKRHLVSTSSRQQIVPGGPAALFEDRLAMPMPVALSRLEERQVLDILGMVPWPSRMAYRWRSINRACAAAFERPAAHKRINAMSRAAKHGHAHSLNLLCRSAQQTEVSAAAGVCYLTNCHNEDEDSGSFGTVLCNYCNEDEDSDSFGAVLRTVLPKESLHVFKQYGVAFSSHRMIWWQRAHEDAKRREEFQRRCKEDERRCEEDLRRQREDRRRRKEDARHGKEDARRAQQDNEEDGQESEEDSIQIEDEEEEQEERTSEEDVGEPGPQPAAEVHVPAELKLEEVHEANADLLQAMQESRIAVPPPLLDHGYVLLSLTRMARSPAVDEALTSAPSLNHCFERLSAAGCHFKPPWGNGARFLVPFTEEQLKDLVAAGLDITDSAILLLREDVAAIKEAFKSLPRKGRPHISEQEHAASTAELGSELGEGNDEACDDDEPIIREVRSAESTDSDWGFVGLYPAMTSSFSSHLNIYPGPG